MAVTANKLWLQRGNRLRQPKHLVKDWNLFLEEKKGLIACVSTNFTLACGCQTVIIHRSDLKLLSPILPHKRSDVQQQIL